MTETSYLLTFVGGLFLLSMFVSHVARKLKIPRATLLILSGILLGPFGLDWVNGLEQSWFPTISSITMLVIGYLLGTKLTKKYFIEHGQSASLVAVVMTLSTFIVVSTGLWLINVPLPLALLFGAISVATDPAATIDVIDQDPNKLRDKPFNQLIRGVVAIDDVLGLLLFSFVIALLAGFSASEQHQFTQAIGHFVYDTFGAMLIGAGLGALLTYLLNHKPHNRPAIIEAFGLILLCGGITSLLGISYLLAAMTMGIIVINFVHKSRTHLHDVELIEQPFLVLFFILAGASLELTDISTVSLALTSYILLRLLGRTATGYLIAVPEQSDNSKLKLGLAFTSQAGVAMGMALVAAGQFPDYKQELLSVTIAATVFFELSGPVLTNWAIKN